MNDVKNVTAMGAATMLQLWVDGKITCTKEGVLAYIEVIDNLLQRCESKGRVKGWLDYDDPTEPDIAGMGEE